MTPRVVPIKQHYWKFKQALSFWFQIHPSDVHSTDAGVRLVGNVWFGVRYGHRNSSCVLHYQLDHCKTGHGTNQSLLLTILWYPHGTLHLTHSWRTLWSLCEFENDESLRRNWSINSMIVFLPLSFCSGGVYSKCDRAIFRGGAHPLLHFRTQFQSQREWRAENGKAAQWTYKCLDKSSILWI